MILKHSTKSIWTRHRQTKPQPTWKKTQNTRTIIRCAKGFDPDPKPPTKKNKKEVYTVEAEVEEPEGVVQEVPSYVANRMLTRIFIFCGVPVFIGLLTLPGFYYLKVVQDVKVPLALVYGTQILTFGTGLLGITYAILSTSPGKQDDFIGFEYFKMSVKSLLEK